MIVFWFYRIFFRIWFGYVWWFIETLRKMHTCR